MVVANAEKQSSVHHYLIATISSPLMDGFNIGPSEANWEETPFICGTDLCEDFDKVYYSLDMRRLKAMGHNAVHQYIDLSFVSAGCPLGEARMNFLFSNFFLEEVRSNFEKGLYQEMHAVDAPDGGFDDSEDDEDYMDDEEAKKVMGHLVVAYPTSGEEEVLRYGGGRQDFSSRPVKKFAGAEENWDLIRQLCALLPAKCTFRRVAFYREISGTCRYKYLLLVQINRLSENLGHALKCLNGVRFFDENGNGPLVELYREADFEVDIEALQMLVTAAETVKCVGPCLEVKFRDEPGAKKRSLRGGMRPFKPTKEVDYKWSSQLDSNSNLLVRRRTIALHSPKYSWASSSHSNSQTVHGNRGKKSVDSQRSTSHNVGNRLQCKTSVRNLEDQLNNNVGITSPGSGRGRLSRLGKFLKSSLLPRKWSTQNSNTQNASRSDTGYGTFEMATNNLKSGDEVSSPLSWRKKLTVGRNKGCGGLSATRKPAKKKAVRKNAVATMLNSHVPPSREEEENNNECVGSC